MMYRDALRSGARRWFREAGIEPQRDRHGPGVPNWKITGTDSPARIAACLCCDTPPERCSGSCPKVLKIQ